jgi:hypothetical protein
MTTITALSIPVREENLPDPFFDEGEYITGSYQRGGGTGSCTIAPNPGTVFPPTPVEN